MDAGKADVVLRSILFIYTHTLPMLPGETLVTLPEERGGREGREGREWSERVEGWREWRKEVGREMRGEGGREGGRGGGRDIAMQIEGRFVAQSNLKSLEKQKKTRENISLKS